MIKVVIVDDEIPVRDELEYLLSKKDNILEIVGKGQTGLEAVKLCEELNPDVIFLDIHMYSMNGMEAAKLILNRHFPPIIIFTTAYEEYAVKAFELNAIDYILKPLSEKRLNVTIDKIQGLLKNRQPRNDNVYKAIYNIENALNINAKLGFWWEDKYVLINYEEIVYLEACRKHTLVYTFDKKYESTSSFGELENKLDKKVFIRIHRSYIININHIKEVGEWFSNRLCVVMRKYERNKIPISKNNLKKFKNIIGMK